MKNNYKYDSILSAALESGNIDYSEICSHETEIIDGYYHVCIITDFQRHEYVVDALSYEVIGYNSEPAAWNGYKPYCA